ncbi:hypothetical protein F4819DRAFT_276099 [Hypoxylon fuscum]|nr:hypothetical protein F4819DRAFT_276099 [Hypoxylon fuscum]
MAFRIIGVDLSPEEGQRDENRYPKVVAADDDSNNTLPIHLGVLTPGPALQGIPRMAAGVPAVLINSACGCVGYLHRDPQGQACSPYMNTRFPSPLVAPSTSIHTTTGNGIGNEATKSPCSSEAKPPRMRRSAAAG